MSPTSDAENAVRAYLQFLKDPESLRDQARIAELEAAIADASDPIAALRATSELRRARSVDGEHVKVQFMLYAKEWAEQEEIGVEDFRLMGVPDDVLSGAGFGARVKAPTGARRGRPPKRESAAPAKPRAKQVKSEDIAAWIKQQPESFTVADVIAGAGGSPLTVRKVIDDLVASADVKRLGPDLSWPGPGRAPIRYQAVSA